MLVAPPRPLSTGTYLNQGINSPAEGTSGHARHAAMTHLSHYDRLCTVYPKARTGTVRVYIYVVCTQLPLPASSCHTLHSGSRKVSLVAPTKLSETRLPLPRAWML